MLLPQYNHNLKAILYFSDQVYSFEGHIKQFQANTYLILYWTKIAHFRWLYILNKNHCIN